MDNQKYEPITPVVKHALYHLEKANDIGYLIRYWQMVGSFNLPEVPAVEKTSTLWHNGLNLF